MKAEGSVKQEHILEAAVKRFSHFGINKTTLAEIADDLSISKPSVFYYFHDKNSLITAVARKIINELLDDFQASLESADTVEAGLYSLVEVKRKHLKKYFLLALQGENIDMLKISASMSEVYHQARERSLSLISTLLKKGIDQGILKPVDTEITGNILLDTLAAYEYCIKISKAVPDIEDLDGMFNKQKIVLEMFLNGLKKSEWKN